MKNLLLTLFTVVLILGCSSEPKVSQSTAENEQTEKIATPDLKTDIAALITFFSTQKGKSLDRKKANEMVDKTEQFVMASPDDEKAPEYLFIAGEVARSLKQYGDAINLFSKVENNYPNYERAPDALFLKGFTYEENLSDKEMAKKYYQEFLDKYPDHQRTKEVKQLLTVIDISPEELIKRFQQQNQQ